MVASRKAWVQSLTLNKSCMVVHTYNLSTQKVKKEESEVKS